MCLPSAPQAPPPMAERQSPQAPDTTQVAARAAQIATNRQGYAASIFTPPGGLAAPATANKTLLGA